MLIILLLKCLSQSLFCCCCCYNCCILVRDINCSDVQSTQISSRSCKTTDVHRTTSCGGCDDFERQDFCHLLRVTIHRRLHVTRALHSTTKHFCQWNDVPAQHCCWQQLFISEWSMQCRHLASESDRQQSRSVAEWSDGSECISDVGGETRAAGGGWHTRQLERTQRDLVVWHTCVQSRCCQWNDHQPLTWHHISTQRRHDE